MDRIGNKTAASKRLLIIAIGQTLSDLAISEDLKGRWFSGEELMQFGKMIFEAAREIEKLEKSE